ncbi:MAG: hypothetical protein HY842_06650 [Bacteroidetes bacterium]|nr:hypothetical protein [Bacteroidota bacterium]
MKKMLSKLHRGQQGLNKVNLSAFTMIFMLTFLLSCQSGTKPGRKAEKSFFDLKAYFESETQRLANGNKAKKIVAVGNIKEEQVLDSINYRQELGIFSASDINRPAWSDKYKTDSIFNDEKELVRLDYTAADEKLKTRKISIDFEKQTVVGVFIENNTTSTIASSRQILAYRPATGYTIESHQDAALTNDQFFSIEVQFLK